MAWNGSHQSQSAESEAEGQTPSAKNDKIGLTYFIILAVVVAVAAAAYFAFRGNRGGQSPRGEPEPSRGKIAEVKPAAAPKAEEAVPEAPKPIDPNARPTRVGEVVNGYVMLPSGRIHRRVGVITNAVGRQAKAPYAIFKHRCNNEIACYLSLKPGDVLVGTRQYTGRFKDEFLKSIETPIIVAQDDPPEIAQLKRDVVAARLQLKDALDQGEDIEQIMVDTRNELQLLMRVKNSIQHLFNQEVKQCETEQDVDDYLEACNKVLAEKGIAPISCNKITKLNILRDMRERRGDSIDDLDDDRQEAAENEATAGAEATEGDEK